MPGFEEPRLLSGAESDIELMKGQRQAFTPSLKICLFASPAGKKSLAS